MSNAALSKSFMEIDISEKMLLEIKTLRNLIDTQWTDFESFEEGVRAFLWKLFEDLKPQNKSDLYLNSFQMSLDSKCLHGVHDLIMNRLYDQFGEEDQHIFTNCISLCKSNVSAAQLGANKYFSISLPAAIVELASLDSHTAPTEKSNCLSTAYDLIFAQLKLAMAEEIAGSQNENRIPVVETRDVIPILAYVIAKSKPKHLYSNMYYVQAFSNIFNDNRHIQHIFENYQVATQCIIDLMVNDCDGLRNAWDLTVFSQIMSDLDVSERGSLRDNEIRRTVELISTSHENI